MVTIVPFESWTRGSRETVKFVDLRGNRGKSVSVVSDVREEEVENGGGGQVRNHALASAAEQTSGRTSGQRDCKGEDEEAGADACQ